MHIRNIKIPLLETINIENIAYYHLYAKQFAEIDNMPKNSFYIMTYEEIKEKYNKAYKAYNTFRQEFERSWDFNNRSYTDFRNTLYASKEFKEYDKWDALERLTRIPTLREASEFDLTCKIAFTDFMKTVNTGYISNWDGSGYYGTADKVSDIGIDIEQMRDGHYREDMGYIYWYNK